MFQSDVKPKQTNKQTVLHDSLSLLFGCSFYGHSCFPYNVHHSSPIYLELIVTLSYFKTLRQFAIRNEFNIIDNDLFLIKTTCIPQNNVKPNNHIFSDSSVALGKKYGYYKQ